jgi:hypothetical protein
MKQYQCRHVWPLLFKMLSTCQTYSPFCKLRMYFSGAHTMGRAHKKRSGLGKEVRCRCHENILFAIWINM